MKRYNKSIYWNDNIDNLIKDKLSNKYNINCGYHCSQRIKEYNIPQFCYKACLYGDIVEVEINDDNITKIITRLNNKYNTNEDLCFCIIFRDKVAFVKTLWLNDKLDNHKTINLSNYEIC